MRIYCDPQTTNSIIKNYTHFEDDVWIFVAICLNFLEVNFCEFILRLLMLNSLIEILLFM